MRVLLILASVLLLAGCTDSDWAHVMSGVGVGSDKPPAYPDSAAAANYAAYAGGHGSVPTPEQKCARVAKERSDDVTAQGFEAEVQQQVYDSTYADCIAWASHTAH